MTQELSALSSYLEVYLSPETRRKKRKKIIVPPVPKGSSGDTLAGCGHRSSIGRTYYPPHDRL